MPGIQEELETQVQPLPHCPGFISAAVANTVTQSSTREEVAFWLPIPGGTRHLGSQGKKELRRSVTPHPQSRAERGACTFPFSLLAAHLSFCSLIQSQAEVTKW